MNVMIRPGNEQELLSMLRELPEYHIVNGGTVLMIRYKNGFLNQAPFICINELKELKGITREGNRISIGGAVTHAEVMRSQVIREYYPELVAACTEVGSWQIRTTGTLAGNIVNSSPAGDTLPPLMAGNAELELVCSEAAREVAFDDFFTGPGTNSLKKGEFLRRVFLPAEKGRGVFFKMGQRRALAISKVSLAVRITARYSICAGAVSKTPLLAKKTAEHLDRCGEKVSFKQLREACDIIGRECAPITDVRSTAEYRQKMIANLLEEALKKLGVSGSENL
ncbi:MAG: FAD binding domain-containing protein [Candidatus Wallbacteria bacterium]|nr:FAD binding domain-containing protein [Candidatus Wallbacteria bacterium]